MTRVNITSNSNKEDSDALELALAFVDEFDLLADDRDDEGRRDATAAVAATDARGQKTTRTRTLPSSQTRKPEPATHAMRAATSAPRAIAASEHSGGTAPKALNRKDELTYLRAKVRELHVRLELLQNSSSSRSEGAVHDNEEEEKASHTGPVSPELLAQHRTMWENLATRQSKEREKAERENAQLKTLLESQLKVATGLERMLRKRGNVELFRPSDAFKKIKLCRDDSVVDDSALLEESSKELDKIYANVDDMLTSAGINEMPSVSRDTQMKNDDPDMGCHVQFIDNNLLDFDVATVADAVWTFVSQEGMKSVCYYHEDFEVTGNTVGRFFGMKIKEQHTKGDLRGINITRKYVGEDRTVITWITVVEPVAFSGAPIAGIRFRESGALVLAPGPSSSSSSSAGDNQQMKSTTQMRMCCRLSPDMETSETSSDSRNAAASEEQASDGGIVGGVTDFLINSIEGNIAFSSMMIDKLLRPASDASAEEPRE